MKSILVFLFILVVNFCKSQIVEVQIFKLYSYSYPNNLTWHQAVESDSVISDKIYFEPQTITLDLDSNIVVLLDSENRVKQCQIVNKYSDEMIDVDPWCQDKCINFVLSQKSEVPILFMRSYKIVDDRRLGMWSPIWLMNYIER